MTLNDIQHLFAYTEWANALALDAAETLTPEQLTADRQISHGSILRTLAHMAGAEWIWLERWHGRSPVAGAFDQWLACANVPELRTKWQPVVEARQALLAGLNEEDLQRAVAFKLLNGSDNSLPLVQQMQHVVNHATLHRGQVVGMIRQLGIAPPATDLLFFLRELQK